MKANPSTYQRVNLKAWLRLMRWPNLLIVGLTQFVAWWCVIYPLSGPKVLTPLSFLWLCLSTMLIAAGGYIINDYFDIRIDAINKPDKVILERDIPRRWAIIVHSALNVIALGLAAMVALPAGHPEWLLLQLGTTGLLWRYSTTWKRQFMIGNVVVALMTALTIIVLIVYEPLIRESSGFIPESFKDHVLLSPILLLFYFSGFAFLLTWIREIVKDMEDYKGDDEEGCMTMPIKWGLQRSTQFAQLIAVLCSMFLLSSVIYLGALSSYASTALAMYILLVIFLPLLAWTYTLSRRATARHYKQKSGQIKLLMVAGIFSLILYVAQLA